MLKADQKSEEIIHFYPIFLCIWRFFIMISLEGKVHVLIFRLSLPVSGMFEWGVLKHKVPE